MRVNLQDAYKENQNGLHEIDLIRYGHELLNNVAIKEILEKTFITINITGFLNLFYFDDDSGMFLPGDESEWDIHTYNILCKLSEKIGKQTLVSFGTLYFNLSSQSGADMITKNERELYLQESESGRLDIPIHEKPNLFIDKGYWIDNAQELNRLFDECFDEYLVKYANYNNVMFHDICKEEILSDIVGALTYSCGNFHRDRKILYMNEVPELFDYCVSWPDLSCMLFTEDIDFYRIYNNICKKTDELANKYKKKNVVDFDTYSYSRTTTSSARSVTWVNPEGVVHPSMEGHPLVIHLDELNDD